jgi:hypothetical protein
MQHVLLEASQYISPKPKVQGWKLTVRRPRRPPKHDGMKDWYRNKKRTTSEAKIAVRREELEGVRSKLGEKLDREVVSLILPVEMFNCKNEYVFECLKKPEFRYEAEQTLPTTDYSLVKPASSISRFATYPRLVSGCKFLLPNTTNQVLINLNIVLSPTIRGHDQILPGGTTTGTSFLTS